MDRLAGLLPAQAHRRQGVRPQPHVRRGRRGSHPSQHPLPGVPGAPAYLPDRQPLLRRGPKIYPTNSAEFAADHGHARARLLCHADLQVGRHKWGKKKCINRLFLILFVYFSVFGFYLFGDVDPGNFGSLGRSFISLFVLLTTAK